MKKLTLAIATPEDIWALSQAKPHLHISPVLIRCPAVVWDEKQKVDSLNAALRDLGYQK